LQILSELIKSHEADKLICRSGINSGLNGIIFYTT